MFLLFFLVIRAGNGDLRVRLLDGVELPTITGRLPGLEVECVKQKSDSVSKLLAKGMFRPAESGQHSIASIRVGLTLFEVLAELLVLVYGMTSLLVGLPEVALE